MPSLSNPPRAELNEHDATQVRPDGDRWPIGIAAPTIISVSYTHLTLPTN